MYVPASSGGWEAFYFKIEETSLHNNADQNICTYTIINNYRISMSSLSKPQPCYLVLAWT